MVCSEPRDLTNRQLDAIADQAKASLFGHLSRALQSVVSQHPTLPLIFKTFGGGAWLAEEVVFKTFAQSPEGPPQIVSFSDDETVNQTAAACAVARKRERVFAQSSSVEHA
jgi:hypothetical protein